MSILRIAKAPAVAVSPSATVMEAVKKMKDANVGAVVVLDNGVLQGMFSERDVMLRIVFEKKDPDKIAVKDVMTTDVVAIGKNTKPDEAVKLMWEKHIRHLPVVREEPPEPRLEIAARCGHAGVHAQRGIGAVRIDLLDAGDVADRVVARPVARERPRRRRARQIGGLRQLHHPDVENDGGRGGIFPAGGDGRGP